GSKGAGCRLEARRGQTGTGQRPGRVVLLRKRVLAARRRLCRPENRVPPGTISAIVRCGLSGGAEVWPCKRVSRQWSGRGGSGCFAPARARAGRRVLPQDDGGGGATPAPKPETLAAGPTAPPPRPQRSAPPA